MSEVNKHPNIPISLFHVHEIYTKHHAYMYNVRLRFFITGERDNWFIDSKLDNVLLPAKIHAGERGDICL
jgi:hypothetical protein